MSRVDEWTDAELASELDVLSMRVTEIWEDLEKFEVIRQAANRLRDRNPEPDPPIAA